MNLLSFRYFLEVARHLNYSKASEILHISQPGLSKQITSLEKELGFKLFDRTTRKVELTAEGKYLHKKLSPLFQDIESTVSELTNKQAIPETTIKIATVPSAASNYLPNILSMLHKDMPDIEISLYETTSVQAIELLKQQKCHLAFIRTPIDPEKIKKQGLNMLEFSRYPIQLVVAKDHRITKNASVDLYDIRDENFIHYDSNNSPSLYYLLQRACLTAGFVPKTFCVGPEMLTIANLVSYGLGVTIMPKDMIELINSSNITAINLKNQDLQSSISVFWKDSDYLPLNTKVILKYLHDIV
ncbi:LysR family transcriptional regulator [Virgibacillus oceani]